MMDGAGHPEIRSTCAYCGVGCGVLLRPDGQGGLAVRGDPEHPANYGRLCSKGLALGDTVGLEGRVLAPRVAGKEVGWDEALSLVADRFAETIAEFGPDSVALYASGQMLTEDYYVANKLMKGFFGSANIDTNSRLCMASTVAGHKRAFGADTVPGTYEDLEEADLIVLVGSNLAWCHPVLYQRIQAVRQKRAVKLVVIDPRRTASCDGADMHLQLRLGSDVALFNRLLATLYDGGAIDEGYLRHVDGFTAALEAASCEDGAATGLSEAEIDAFCRLWMRTEKVVTVFSQGVNQSSAGVDKVNAILNCHLATGRIGTPGCGPFSVTGQPNAMGGREVGGLANMLACHLDLDNAEHRDAVQAFWKAPAVPDRAGLKAVEMFQAVADGRIKAIWIIHSNPAVSLPEADAVQEALAACPFVVVSDITGDTDTARVADVILPATAWAEKNGTVTNSDRTISRQRAALPAPGQARPDWDILAEVGRRMGWQEAFAYGSAAEIFREHAALSALAGQFGKDFDISQLVDLSDDAYEAFTPRRWPLSATRQGGRFFADGQFYHANGRGRMVAVQHRTPASDLTPEFPYRLNTGRIRDQWHTMTRSGRSARLSAHLPEPFVEIHPRDAEVLGIGPSDLVQLDSPYGRAILRAAITRDVAEGELFAPLHWTGENAPTGRIDALVAAHTDPLSGQPESKATVVSASRFEAAWFGFAISAQALKPNCDYWALARTASGLRAELAGRHPIADWQGYARQLFARPEADAQLYEDRATGVYRIALFEAGVLTAALFLSPRPVTVMRDYLAGLTGNAAFDVLSGQSPADRPDPGPIVCSCFGVGVNAIVAAIEAQGLMTVEAIGSALQAGTNCGSCRPELAQLLRSCQQKEAAE